MLFSINRNPTSRELRQFGITCLCFLPLAGWFGGSRVWTLVGLAVGIACGVLAMVMPRALRPVFLSLSFATAPLGLVTGELASLVMYYGLFTPLGIWFRLLGRDALERTHKPRAATYWRVKKGPVSPARYYRQF